MLNSWMYWTSSLCNLCGTIWFSTNQLFIVRSYHTRILQTHVSHVIQSAFDLLLLLHFPMNWENISIFTGSSKAMKEAKQIPIPWPITQIQQLQLYPYLTTEKVRRKNVSEMAQLHLLESMVVETILIQINKNCKQS